jgi:hypothetical protein
VLATQRTSWGNGEVPSPPPAATALETVLFAVRACVRRDAGMATPKHTPEGRGYMSTLNYWSHKNDFWTMVSDQSGCADTVVDLWQANASAPAGSPAFHLVGTKYEEYLFRDEALSVLHAHPPSGEAPNGRPRPATDKNTPLDFVSAVPLLLFYAAHVGHFPLQVPRAAFESTQLEPNVGDVTR